MSKKIDAIDPRYVYELASIGCTNVEIARIIGCSHDTLTNKWRSELDRGREEAKASIRRKQFEKAMSGNVVMLIWLGKNMLGQTDKVEHEHTIQSFDIVIGADTSDPNELEEASYIELPEATDADTTQEQSSEEANQQEPEQLP